MNKRKEIGERLRMARKAARLKQEDVARFLDTSNSIVSDWENGKRSPGIDQIIDLATLFETTSAYLLGIDSPRTPAQELRSIEYRIDDMTDNALQLAKDYDHLDDYGQRVLRTTADLMLEKHRKE